MQLQQVRDEMKKQFELFFVEVWPQDTKQLSHPEGRETTP